MCWPLGSASTGRSPQQLTRSPFKYLTSFLNMNFSTYFLITFTTGFSFCFAITLFHVAYCIQIMCICQMENSARSNIKYPDSKDRKCWWRFPDQSGIYSIETSRGDHLITSNGRHQGNPHGFVYICISDICIMKTHMGSGPFPTFLVLSIGDW